MRDANGILIALAGFALVFQPDDPITALAILAVLIAVKLVQGWRRLHRKA